MKPNMKIYLITIIIISWSFLVQSQTGKLHLVGNAHGFDINELGLIIENQISELYTRNGKIDTVILLNRIQK